jgi:hypothetical protein
VPAIGASVAGIYKYLALIWDVVRSELPAGSGYDIATVNDA